MSNADTAPFPVPLVGLNFEAEESSATRNDVRSSADPLSLSIASADGVSQSAAWAGRLDSPSDVDWYRISARGPFASNERLVIRFDSASDSRWFDRHEVSIETTSGHLLKRAQSGGDLVLELRAGDTVVDLLNQRAEFYVKVSAVSDAEHAHRSDPYRFIIERRSAPDQSAVTDTMAVATPIRLVDGTAIVAAYRADVAYVASPDNANEWLLAGLSGDTLGGTLVRLSGISALQFLDLTVNLGPPNPNLSSEQSITLPTASTAAMITAPDGWRHHGPSGLGDNFDQAGTSLTRIVFDAGLGRLDLSAASGSQSISSAPSAASSGLSANLADARLGSVSGLAEFRADPEFMHIDGTGSTVVIIDSGIDLDHPAFGNERVVFSQDFSGSGDADASDFTGHGTHIAGIIASADTRFPGVAPGARLIVLKALGDDGSGDGYDIREAIAWTLANRDRYDINVVNLSLGFGEFYTEPSTGFLSSPLRALAQSGVIIVAAAGNQYVSRLQAEQHGVAYPAADPSVIGVGASWGNPDELNTVMPAGKDAFNHASGGVVQAGSTDAIALFSQRDAGDHALSDVFAPGVHILSADTQGGFTQVLSGTSMAAAQISGIAALAQSVALERLGRRLSPGEFMQLLEQTADLIPDTEVATRDGSSVDNTGLSFPRVNLQALARAISQLSDTSQAGTPFDLIASPPTATDDDRLQGVDDWIIGTPLAERLWGGSGHDRLQGSGGDDSLVGGIGDDWLQPGLTGSHWLDGGTGHDTVSYAGPRALYHITSVGRLTLVRTPQGGEDLMLDVERLLFADQSFPTTTFQSALATESPHSEPATHSLQPRLPELAALVEAQPDRPGVVALAAFHAEAFEQMAASAASDPTQPLLDPVRLFTTVGRRDGGEPVLDLILRSGMRPISEGLFIVNVDPAQARFDADAVSAPDGWHVETVNRLDQQGNPSGEVMVTARRSPDSPPLTINASPQTLFSLRLIPHWDALQRGQIDGVQVQLGRFTDAAGFEYAPAAGTSTLLQLAPSDLAVSGVPNVSGNVSVLGTPAQDAPLQIREDLIDTLSDTPLSSRGLRVQWFELRAGIPVPIPGATETVFTPSQAQVGRALGVRVQLGLSDSTEFAYSPFTAVVANVNDVPVGAIRLSGSARLGERLTALTSVTDADGIPESGPDAPRIQWFADGDLVQEDPGDSLLLTAALLGRKVHARLIYTDHFGAAEHVDSDPTSAIAALATVDPEKSRAVPSLSGVAGDGNGDGIPDIQQLTVLSAPIRLLSQPNLESFLTLVADSNAGKTQGNTDTRISAFSQTIDGVVITPTVMATPLGQIQFNVVLDKPGKTESFSLYVQGVQVNGYWKQDASGTWVNLASPPFGGQTKVEGDKIRLDFQIRDGHWPFDADGVVNGLIVDPGMPALMAQSAALYRPALVTDGLWF